LKLLVTFETIGAALYFEEAVKNNSLVASKIIPTPRCLGISCSYSALIEYQQNVNISGFIKNDLVGYSKIYKIIIDDNGDEVYELYRHEY
jgi:hypothetical protein